MSYDLQLGDVPIDAGSPLVAWANAVKTRGNMTSLMPAQSPNRGLIAEKISAARVPKGARFNDSRAFLLGNYWYVPASDVNQKLYNALGQSYKDAIARDKFWDALQPMSLLKDAGTLAREGVSAITGIPTWAIPVALLAAGAFAVHTVVGGIGDGIRRL